jgi:hypothetical protein
VTDSAVQIVNERDTLLTSAGIAEGKFVERGHVSRLSIVFGLDRNISAKPDKSARLGLRVDAFPVVDVQWLVDCSA